MVLKSIEKLRDALGGALRAGEGVAERVALAEVDAAIQTRVQGIIIPTAVVALLFAAAELAAASIGDQETLRLAITSIVLAAWLYGMWALIEGLFKTLPLAVVWWSARVGPHKLAQLFLYQLIISKFRQVFAGPDGKASLTSHVMRYALQFSGGPASWEGYALQLASRIAPRMVAHAYLRAAMVMSPVVAAWAYYRIKIFPDLIMAKTGLGMWSAFLYPLAALADAVAGTSWRAALLALG